MTNEAIFRRASDTWGAVAQMIVAVEECAELQQAIIKAIRTGKSSINLAEEIADVSIMLDQLVFLFPEIDTKVKAWRKTKLARLENKLDAVSK